MKLKDKYHFILLTFFVFALLQVVTENTFATNANAQHFQEKSINN